MKRFFVCLLALFMFAGSVFADNSYRDSFGACIKNGEYDQAYEIIRKWEAEEPGSIEVLIAKFNYYVNRSAESYVVEGRMDDGRYGSFPRTSYNSKDVKKGVSFLDKALKANPDRLDIYCGKAHVLILSGDYKTAVKTIVALLQRSVANGFQWQWTDNEPMGEDAYGVVQDVCNDYFIQLRRSDVPSSLLEQFVKKEVEVFPESAVALNHMALFYSSLEDYDREIEVLLKAYGIAEDDYVIVGNLAYAYELKGDFDSAEKYYRMLLDFDDEDAREYGRNGLEIISEKRGQN